MNFKVSWLLLLVCCSFGLTFESITEIQNDTKNCTSPAIEHFPRDIFSPLERRQGYVIIHMVAAVYIFYCLAKLCDDYFVPCMDCVCEDFGIPGDIVGASFMAAAASSPELFTNIIATFVTQGDVGVGTITGSAVFNIFGVCAVCGIFSQDPLPLQSYPLTRDCFFYATAVILLSLFLHKQQIWCYEALTLLLLYAVYIAVLMNNGLVKRMAAKLFLCAKLPNSYVLESTPLLSATDDLSENLSQNENDIELDSKDWQLFHAPSNSRCLVFLGWLVSWPVRFCFTFTIPDCRKTAWRAWFPITTLITVLWIGGLSYLVNWMMTIIGHTLSIPDSVMGLTLIAAGTSMPELVSSVLIVRRGMGGQMGVSTSLGSNTIDILMCLGLPWFIRSSMMTENYVRINSAGLSYTVGSLLLAVTALYTTLALNKFILDRKVGLISLFLYASFLVFASCWETNVFGVINLPECETDF